MKPIKAIATMVITVTMLCGGMAVQASTGLAHVHAYSHFGPILYNVTPGASHQYISATHTDSSGKVTYFYSECQTTHNWYKEYDKCACGSVINYMEYAIEDHKQCGKR